MWQGAKDEDLQAAAAALRAGGLVAFPTETVYGLGADGLNAAACAQIFEAKGRPQDNPLILHIADRAMLEDIVEPLPPAGQALADRFWPGPLTLILRRRETVPDVVTAGLDTVAVRWPDHPVAQALIRATGRPLAAPSANKSGRPSPTQAWHVQADFGDELAGVIDGGQTAVGVESTIVDVTVDPPSLLRPGGITKEALEAVIGPVADPTLTNRPKAPGMKYRHYAPNVPVLRLPNAGLDTARAFLAQHAGEKVGLLLDDESLNVLAPFDPSVLVWNLGPKTHPELAAARLFDGLRRLEAAGCDIMLIASYDETGMGLAVANRINKLSQPLKEEDA
ncbi:L-threonylcarbamoyladenylate synthase [Peptococcus simiae]|uniref:Threonylcarbamoyl-AMP synthase n=1 Tax=Peptococcus simiae TaxID=1643805 RepID=A0ABW9GZM8_9FIRM